MTKNATQFLLFATLISTLIFGSCSSKPNSLSAIPENAQMVVSIDLKSLYSKGELSDMQDLEMIKLMKDDMKNEDQKIQDFMQSLLDDPESSGVNLRKEMFIYIVNDGEENKYTCVTMDLHSESDFEKFIGDIKGLDRDGAVLQPTEKDNFKYSLQGNDLAIGWDDSKMVMAMPFNYRSGDNLEYGIKKMFSIPNDRIITEIASFNSFRDNTKDINLWLSSDMFVGEREFAMAERDLGFNLRNNYLVAHLDFDEDQIVIDLEAVLNENVKDQMGPFMSMSGGVDDDLLEFLPEENYMVAGMHFDVDDAIENMQARDGYEEISREFEKEMGYPLHEMLAAIGGDVAINIFDFTVSEYGSPDPIFAAVMNMEDEDMIDQLMQKAEDEGIQKRNGYLTTEIGYQNYMFIGKKDDMIMVTNDEISITKFIDGELDNNLNDDAVASSMEDHGMYMRMKLNGRDYPQSMKRMFNDMRGDEKAAFDLWNEEVENVEMYMDDNTHYTVRLNLTEKDENSLYRIIKMIDRNFNKLM